MLRSRDKIFVAGHNGLAGSAIVRKLHECGYHNIVTRTRDKLDLCHQEAVRDFLSVVQPDVVILAAAKVGGIMANWEQPVPFLLWNLQIETNVISAAFRYGNVRQLLFLGSSCIYPREALQPIVEDSLMSGPLEFTNEAYAIAKIAGVKLCEAYRRQYGQDYRSVMPTNLYGPHDNFADDTSHLLPALMRRAHEAKVNRFSKMVVWGTGAPRRELLHSDDMAEACLAVLRAPNGIESVINIGTGQDATIREIAEMVCDVVGFRGDIVFDTSKPDGTPRKVLDISRITEIGWRPKIGLREGIEQTYAWYLENCAAVKAAA